MKHTKGKLEWIAYTTDTNLKCAYTFDESISEYRIKVTQKLPKGFYYSALNEAGKYFDEIILPELNKEIVIGDSYFTKNGVNQVILLTITDKHINDIYLSGGIARKKEHLCLSAEFAKQINY